MELKPGMRLRSTMCATQVAVVRAPAGQVELACGGAPLTADLEGGPEGAPAAGLDGGSLIGKRYVADGVEIELLCTRAGDGSLTVDGALMVLKEAKPLPSSD